MRRENRRSGQTGRLIVVAVAITASLAACSSTSINPAPVFYPGLAKDSDKEAAPLRRFTNCRKDVLAFDKAADIYADEGKYLASARRAAQCLEILSSKTGKIVAREALQLHALTMRNYLIGGDPKSAKDAYIKMSKQFPDQDLIFKDASSVKETFAYILEIRSGKDSDNFRRANISPAVKAELRRLKYHQKQ